MADISKLEEQANLLMNNVSGWEQNVLTRIGKRIKKYGKLSLEDVKSINNIAVVKQDMEAITKELAKVTGYNISQIEQRRYEYNGENLTLREWSNKTGLSRDLLSNRINGLGWSFEKAITTPVKEKYRHLVAKEREKREK